MELNVGFSVVSYEAQYYKVNERKIREDTVWRTPNLVNSQL